MVLPVSIENIRLACVVCGIYRECDTDTELKGSASTSLMKSIIGQTGGKNR